MNLLLLLPIVFPILAGICFALCPWLSNRRVRNVLVVSVLAMEVLFVLACKGERSLTLFCLSDRLVFSLCADELSMLFGVLSAAMWLASAVYTADYMKHEERERFYQVFFLVSIGIVIAVCFSANLETMYLFYELMTLALFPLIVHDRTPDAIKAGWKYLLYSVGGAFLGLAGLILFYSSGVTLEFVPGGSLALAAQGDAFRENMLLTACLLSIIGFGSKAGMFPLHGWLPAAHPVAPAPASAFLSGNVTKIGVLFILRVVYYVAGPGFLRGTWAQHAFLALTLLTILMGSVLASREQRLKRRLAYSTISQVSYCLFGIALLHPTALCGALMHVVFHSLAKNTLFLSAGAMIHQTGCARADELRGIGGRMPTTTWLFTLASFTLIGVPPASAFLSKWYLAEGALQSGIPVVCYAGPAILLVSAVFTAAYLLPVTVNGFFPGRDEAGKLFRDKKNEVSGLALAPMAALTAGALLFGMFPNGLVRIVMDICDKVL